MAFQNASRINIDRSTVNNAGGDINFITNTDLGGEHALEKLKPVEMDASFRRECLEGTRADLLKFIDDWASMLDSQHRVLWLYGMAGSGKSTLMTTLANQFRASGQLGAFLFFNRDIADRHRPVAVIRTTVYQLSCNYPDIGRDVLEVMDRFPSIIQSPVQLQWSKLLVEPLARHVERFHTPVVLVFDGLDECGDVEERRKLLQIFSTGTKHLPAAIRIIIASRSEDDIRLAFDANVHVLTHRLDTDSKHNSLDIQIYFRHEMAFICDKQHYLPHTWPGDEAIQQLTDRACGLFVWASTAVELIRNAHYPDKRLKGLLQEGVKIGSRSALDNIYRIALEDAGKWYDEDFIRQFRAILGLVLVARIPLSIQAIDHLLGFRSADTISSMACILTESPTVRILHPSLADFLTQSGEHTRAVWNINTSSSGVRLALSCLDRLDGVLQRNMCNLTFSSRQVDALLGEDVSYACLFWIDHVCRVRENIVGFAQRVDTFLNRHLLHWFEAMSILKKSRNTIVMLHRLRDWIRMYASHPLNELINDACRFSEAFVDSIADHPLSVYLVALPFAPIKSAISHIFHDSFSLPSIVGGFESSWSPLLRVFAVQETEVASFSHDGSKVACGCGETINVWDVTSGAQIRSPIEGRPHDVRAIAFSRGSNRTASVDSRSTVRIWDGTSKVKVLVDPGEWAENLITLSPDGLIVVSVSRYENQSLLRVLDSSSGKELSSFSHDAIFSIAFSPDGFRIGLALGDNVIEILDTVLWRRFLGPLRPSVMSSGEKSFGLLRRYTQHREDAHTLDVRHISDETIAIQWSANETRIVTGSSQGVLCMWNAISGSEIFSIRNKDRGSVSALAFSPDGTRIACGFSNENSIHVLDATTGKPSFKWSPLRGHNGSILALAFSSDSARLMSGSRDKTVRVWDIHTRHVFEEHRGQDSTRVGLKTLLSEPRELLPRSPLKISKGDRPSHKRDSAIVTAIAFSHDGKRIASAATGEICVWQVDTGAKIGQTSLGKTAVYSLAFSPGGGRFASLTSDDKIRMHDATSCAEIYALEVQTHLVNPRKLVFSPDGRRLLHGYANLLYLWDTLSGLLVAVLKGHKDDVVSASFSPSGKQIVSGSSDLIIRVWDAASGETLFPPIQTHDHVPASVAFSPGGKRIVSLSGPELKTWDIIDGKPRGGVKAPVGVHGLHEMHFPIGITAEEGFIVDLSTRRILSKLPSSIYTHHSHAEANPLLSATAACKDAIAFSTSSGRFIIMRFPSVVLNRPDTRPAEDTIHVESNEKWNDLWPVEKFYWSARDRSIRR